MLCDAMLTDRSRLRLQAHRYADTDAARRAGRRCTHTGTECAEYPILWVLEGRAVEACCRDDSHGCACLARIDSQRPLLAGHRSAVGREPLTIAAHAT